MNDKRVFDRISEAVGWTPMVRLHRSVEGPRHLDAITALAQLDGPERAIISRSGEHC